MSTALATDLCKRADKAFSLREPWLGLWQELADNFFPEHADFHSDPTWGDEYASHLSDDSPLILRRDLANSFAAMLRPRGQKWFKASLVDDNLMDAPGVADWLDDVSDTMMRAIYDPKAGFNRATKEADHFFATFGNAVLLVEENVNAARLRFRHFHLKDCAWLEDADGEVDTFYRRMKMTARQMKQKFGEKALHPDVRKACAEDGEKEFTVQHCMMPAEDCEYLDGAPKLKKKFKWWSFYTDIENKHDLRNGGSHEFRYCVPRWQTLTGSPYAISPATMDALPAARQIQAMALTTIEALQKMVDPPIRATEESIRGDINMFAGGVTWVDRDHDIRQLGPPLEVFDVARNAVLGVQALEAAKLGLSNAMFVSKLNIPQTNAKTAYEVQQLVEEYIRAAIPLFEPLETSYNAPILNAVFDIMLRIPSTGFLESMPEALQGRDIDWSFDNPLQQAQERVKFQTFIGMSQTAQAAMQFDPGVVNDIDWRTATRDAIRGSGAPADWLRDREEADNLVKEQAKAAQAASEMQQIAMAGGAAQAAGDGVASVAQAVQSIA
jgi:hypothetical protein